MDQNSTKKVIPVLCGMICHVDISSKSSVGVNSHTTNSHVLIEVFRTGTHSPIKVEMCVQIIDKSLFHIVNDLSNDLSIINIRSRKVIYILYLTLEAEGRGFDPQRCIFFIFFFIPAKDKSCR